MGLKEYANACMTSATMAPSMWVATVQALVLAVGQQIYILGIAGILTVVVDVIPKAQL